jgi:quinolinate synthase
MFLPAMSSAATTVPAPIEYPTTAGGMFTHLEDRLGEVMPEAALRRAAEIAIEINGLKRAMNAIILGHNYMEPALYHSVPDYTGDSLGLSRIAAAAEVEVIVFCGVRFMAETAKILNPTRTVLLPSPKGGCSLAEAINAEQVRSLRRKYPGLPVVSYVNTYAAVKAESDYCCTSGNASAVVNALREQGHDRIIFIPDEYLTANTARELGMKHLIERPAMLSRAPETIDPNTLIGWAGRCEVHERFDVSDVRAARAQYPDVLVLAHPECSPEVIAESDFSGSTTQMLRKVDETPSGHLMLLTECSMADNIASRSPDRELIRTCSIRCPHMNEITLDETLAALEQRRYLIEVEPSIADRSRVALNRMISTG